MFRGNRCKCRKGHLNEKEKGKVQYDDFFNNGIMELGRIGNVVRVEINLYKLRQTNKTYCCRVCCDRIVK